MSETTHLTIILAAGKGTRMKSTLPKVLHPVGGLSMLGHALAAARAAGSRELAVVIGSGMEAARAEVNRLAPTAQVFVQAEQRGTADAVLAARPALANSRTGVVVLFGDTPLILPETITRLLRELDSGADLAVLGFEAADPTGYGRLITEPSGAVIAVREHKDASPAERAIRLCNGGAVAFRGACMLALFDRIQPHNAQGEYYMTDAVALAHKDGLRTTAIVTAEDEIMGINSRDQLAGGGAHLPEPRPPEGDA